MENMKKIKDDEVEMLKEIARSSQPGFGIGLDLNILREFVKSRGRSDDEEEEKKNNSENHH
jgi:hypothetical protein